MLIDIEVPTDYFRKPLIELLVQYGNNTLYFIPGDGYVNR